MRLLRDIKKLSKGLLVLILFIFGINKRTEAQAYGGTVNHDGYSFDYTIQCGGDPTTAVVTLWYTSAEPTDVVPQLHLGGGVFVNMNGPSPYTYTITGLTSCDFSFFFYIAWSAGGLYQDFTPNTPGNTTPLSNEFFLFFEAKHYRDESVLLDWATNTDVNSEYFDIERSIDGFNWIFVDQVNAIRDGITSVIFTYKDSSPKYSSENFTYYRIKMIDLNGHHEYSSARVLKKVKENKVALSLYPNPTNSSVNVDFSNIDWSFGDVFLRIYDLQGKQVHSKTFSRAEKEEMNLQNFPSSLYTFLFLQGDNIIYQGKVIKED